MIVFLVEAAIILTSILFYARFDSQVLFLEIGILAAVSTAYVMTQKYLDIYDRIIGGAMLFIAMGLPIIFTSITRSVFEVTKLLVFRLGLIAIVTAWLTRCITRKNTPLLFNEELSLQDQKIFKLGPLQWVQTGIEWPLFAWILSNVASTFASPCWPIPLIGAYDRWEGLWLVLNYVLLLWIFAKFSQQKRFFNWMFGALLITAILSSVYGILQSNGWDFMRWSVDPTARVFASINNPVHFSAYIIMLVPLAFCWICFLLSSKKTAFSFQNIGNKINGIFAAIKQKKAWSTFWNDGELKKDLLIILTSIGMLIMFYTGNYLSFGRATWIGTAISLSYVFYLLTNLINKKSIYTLAFDFASFTLLLALAVLIFSFNALSLNSLIAGALITLMLAALALNYALSQDIKNFVLRIAIILYATQLQFTTVGLISVLVVVASIVAFHKLSKSFIPTPSVRSFLVFVLAGFFMLMAVRSIPNIYSSEMSKLSSWMQVKTAASAIKANQTSTHINAYLSGQTSILKTGSARVSMWKSGIVWANTYPLFGTGPGTIKEMYPTFRRSDYGRLEGGQNFTPDKLHNEYINVMATNGYTGFIIYFLWLIPAFFWIVITTISRNQNKPSTYLIVGLLGGCLVYWGQTLFNFGVVATKGLFYELMGLTLAIVTMNPWKDFQGTATGETSETGTERPAATAE